MEGILDGDSDYERRRVITGSETLRDDIMEIAYKIGLSSSYVVSNPRVSYLKEEDRFIVGRDPYYTISIKHKKRILHRPPEYCNESWVDYDGMVYCIHLVKWHTVLVRRNGKAIWCGQCDIPYLTEMKNRHNERYTSGFDHARFFEWARTREYPVFVCEYSAPEDFVPVASISKRNTFNDKHNLKRTENLFVHSRFAEAERRGQLEFDF